QEVRATVVAAHDQLTARVEISNELLIEILLHFDLDLLCFHAGDRKSLHRRHLIHEMLEVLDFGHVRGADTHSVTKQRIVCSDIDDVLVDSLPESLVAGDRAEGDGQLEDVDLEENRVRCGGIFRSIDRSISRLRELDNRMRRTRIRNYRGRNLLIL